MKEFLIFSINIPGIRKLSEVDQKWNYATILEAVFKIYSNSIQVIF